MTRGSSVFEAARRAARIVAALGVVAACGRAEESAAVSGSAMTAASLSPLVSASQAAGSGRYAGPSAQAADGVAQVTVSATPPVSFDGANNAVLVQGDAAGCTGLHRDGWLQVTCVPEVPARGRFVKGETAEGWSGAMIGIAPLADGRLQFVLPWQLGKRGRAVIEWTNATFELSTNNAGGGFRRVLPQAQADACDKIARDTEARLVALRDAVSGPVRGLDVRRFPKLGVCEVAGADAWALEPKDVRAAGESVDREVSLTLNVVHVDIAGQLAKAVWGPIAFAPAKLAIPDVSLFDYDGDKVAEVIVRHDVLARGERFAGKRLPPLPAVFTYSKSRVTAYAPAGTLGSGATVAEQLESDQRPDIGDYGPYIGWLGQGCGVGKCPERVVGPRFYRRSLPDGSFDPAAPEVTSALQRACSRNQGALVSDVATVGGKARSALNVACARVRGASTDSVLATLSQAKSQVCGDASDCPLFTLLKDWAKAQPPRKLVLPSKE